VILEGVNPYTFTAGILAWAAMTAADSGTKGDGRDELVTVAYSPDPAITANPRLSRWSTRHITGSSALSRRPGLDLEAAAPA
jgi:hypothetical protein